MALSLILSRHIRPNVTQSDNLEWFQSFDRVPIYYDEGQAAVTHALHDALDYLLGSGVAVFRPIGQQDRRLAQGADYFCSVELAALRYERGAESNTYRKFYGLGGDFRRNFLRQARREVVWRQLAQMNDAATASSSMT